MLQGASTESRVSPNSEMQSNLRIRKDFHEQTMLELRAEGCLGKGEESIGPGENFPAEPRGGVAFTN